MSVVARLSQVRPLTSRQKQRLERITKRLEHLAAVLATLPHRARKRITKGRGRARTAA